MMPKNPSDQTNFSAGQIARKLGEQGFTVPPVDTAVVVSDHLTECRKTLTTQPILEYSEIPHLSEVPAGGMYLWKNSRKSALILDSPGWKSSPGRFSVRGLIVRLAILWGVKQMICVDASRPMGSDHSPVAVIRDHVNLFGDNPLIGPNDSQFGVRFPDMSAVYSPRIAENVCHNLREYREVTEERGILIGVSEEHQLTRREHKALQSLGSCYFTSSLVPEIIAASHADIEIGALVVPETTAPGVMRDILSGKVKAV